ncbi:MAG: hypothetical protein ACRETN_04120, partial [Nevskiales bacterium]
SFSKPEKRDSAIREKLNAATQKLVMLIGLTIGCVILAGFIGGWSFLLWLVGMGWAIFYMEDEEWEEEANKLKEAISSSFSEAKVQHI